MLRLRTDRHAVLGLSLANLALFLASGLLLGIILEGVYGSIWERTAQLQTTADTLNASIETLSAAYEDTSLMIRLPTGPPSMRLSCSSQYIHVWSQFGSTTALSVTEPWVVSPWPRPAGSWQSGHDLHGWLNDTYGHLGTVQDPINLTTLVSLKKDRQSAAMSLAYSPVEFTGTSPLIAEKTFVYTEQGEPYVVLLLYQNETKNISMP